MSACSVQIVSVYMYFIEFVNPNTTKIIIVSKITNSITT